jgi:hypothetical protein
VNRGWLIVLGLVAGTAGGMAVVGASASRESAGPAFARPALAEAASPALAIPPPRVLHDGPVLSRWAHVRHAIAARASPAPRSRVVARVSSRTPEGTVTPLPVTGRRRGRDGRLWMRVVLPVLPNGTSGWVRRTDLGAFEVNHHRLVVELARRRLTLFDGRRAVLRARVAVGRPGSPTPRGTFLVRNRLEHYVSPAYGPVAFGTSARSAVLTDWPDGGFVGIHGTDRPELVPGRISHGCVRLRNPDILRLARLMPVGTPVEFR